MQIALQLLLLSSFQEIVFTTLAIQYFMMPIKVGLVVIRSVQTLQNF